MKRGASNFLTFQPWRTILRTLDWGLFPVGGWLWGSPGAFRFSGEYFQSPPAHSPLRIATQLGLDNVPSPVGLIGIQYMSSDGARREVGKLQPGRIGLLVREHNLEARHSAPLVGSVANSAKRQFKIVIFALPAALYYNVGRAHMLSPVAQECVCPFHAKSQPYIVGVPRMSILPGQSFFVDDSSDDSEVSMFNELIQAVHERRTLLLVLQEHEGRLLLAYLMLVEDHDVVAKVLELECLHSWRNRTGVVIFAEYAEIENENRVVSIN